jgi:hypothetical protein
VSVAPAGAEIIDRIMAVVSGRLVLLSDVMAAIELGLVSTAGAADPKAAALTALVERQLQLAEVDRYGPPEPAADAVDRRIAEAQATVGGAEALTRALDAAGLTETQLRAHLRDDFRLQAYVSQRFAPTDQPTEDDLVAYYREHEAAFTRAGVLRPFEDVRGEVARDLAEERRRRLVAAWIEGLRRRADVSVLYQPSAR